MNNMYLDISIPKQVGLLVQSLKKALGPLLYKPFELQMAELDVPLEETLKNLATAAYKQGVEDAKYEALKNTSDEWAARREATIKFLFSDEAKTMGPEERELHALRAFTGADTRKEYIGDVLDLVNVLNKGGV